MWGNSVNIMVQWLLEGRQQNETTKENFPEVMQVVFCKAISSEGAQVDSHVRQQKTHFRCTKIGVQAADSVPLLDLLAW